MVDTVTFQSEQTGQEAPAATENNTSSSASGERPAWLPEQFKTVEDFVKAADDTKAELTRTQQELAKLKKPAGTETKPDGKSGGDTELEIKEGDEEKSDETDKPQPIDFAPYTQEFNETGDVSQESRAKIVESLKSVFGDDAEGIVNDYIEGAKTRVVNTTTQLKAIAGGDEGYAAMIEWARANQSDQEKAAFNRAVNSGDFHTASFAVQAMHGKYTAATGKAPNLISGDNSPSNTGGFKSLNELKLAIADPRYKTDPDYRASVEARAAKSNI